MKKEINLGQLVTDLLDKFPDLRDDDQRLVANVWRYQLDKEELEQLHPMRDFLKLYADGSLVTADKITRVRRKLQETFPQFRGKLWEQRYKHQDQVIEYLNDLENKA
jgi:hypothetical protein